MAMEERKSMERQPSEPLTHEEIKMLMSRLPPEERPVTWKPTVGGLLEIIAGGMNILLGVLAITGSTLGLFMVPVVGSIVGTALIILGIISVIGGSYALRRSMWGWALAGSITGLFPSLVFVLGTLSIIFNVLGKSEFGHEMQPK